MRIYDLIVVGTGISGITVAKLLGESDILLIEKGRNIKTRKHLLYGWFGSSLYTMNNLKSKKATKIFNVPRKLNNKQRNQFANNTYNELVKANDVMFNTEVKKIKKKDGLFNVRIPSGIFYSKACVVATGQDVRLVDDLAIDSEIYIGIRVEVPTRQIKKRLDVRGFVHNGVVGEKEAYGVISSFAYFDGKGKSSKSSFFIGTKMLFSEAIRSIEILNILNGDRIKKERIETFLSGKSYLKEMPFYKDLQDKLAKICKENVNFISSGICYSPELFGRGVAKSDRENKLFCVGKCSNNVITPTDSILSSINTVGVIKEEI